MKFELNKSDREKLNKLIEAKDINISIADMFLASASYECIDDPSFFKSSLNLKDDYLSSLYDFLELDMDDEENQELADKYIKPAIKVLDKGEFVNNPYNKYVKANNIKDGKYSLSYEKYSPYQCFAYDDIDILENDYYHEVSKIGLFKESYRFISLIENKTIWMCITPNEMKTMEPAIKEVKGNVVTFGLGLGYFAFMASNKKDVKSVTVIERDSTIIDLFKKHLLPHFPNKEKIKIIKSDAFDYLENKEMDNYNYAFIDLWHNPEDGLPLYIKCKKYEAMHQKCKFLYWLEKSIIAMYRRCLITVMEEQVAGSKESDYQSSMNEMDEIINHIYKITKEKVFHSYNEIHEFCSERNIKELIKN